MGMRRPAPKYGNLHRSPVPPVQQPAPEVQEHADATPEPAAPKPYRPDSEFTVSVDEARDRLAAIGIERSKDSIQRYCREGMLDARKLGLLSRFFITEPSMSAFLGKMPHDARVSPTTRNDAGVRSIERKGMQPHEDAQDEHFVEKNEPHTGAKAPIQIDAANNALARRRDKLDLLEHSGARSGEQPNVDIQIENAKLQAKLEERDERIQEQKETISFLKEEVTEARRNRGDMKDISEQMFGLLRTMALGGKQGDSSASTSGTSVRAEVIRSDERRQPNGH